jgi:hypothetical protein
MFVPREATELWEAGGVASGNINGNGGVAHVCPFSDSQFDTWRELLDHLDQAEYNAHRMKGLPAEYGRIPDDINGSSAGSGFGGAAVDRTTQFQEIKQKIKKRKEQQMQFKVVERLGQMLYSGPASEGGARKKYEQSLVEWVPDNQAPMCPDCGVKFGFKTRKSHCRLCGGVLCKSCTIDLPAERAQLMHSGASLQAPKPTSCPSQFRVCQNCSRLCESQQRMAKNLAAVRAERDAVTRRAEASTSVYEVMLRELRAIEGQVPKFFDLATRLAAGEALWQFDHAAAVRAGILQRLALVQKMGVCGWLRVG